MRPGSKRTSLGLVPLGVALALALAACGSSNGSSPPASTGDSGGPTASGSTTGGSSQSLDGRKVAVAMPGLITDGSWNEQGYDGLKHAESLGVHGAYTESVTQSQQVQVMRNYAQDGYQRVIGHGGEFQVSANQLAKQFPNTQFVVINGVQAGQNVTSITLSYGDMGYLAGIEACDVTKSGKVGMVVGEMIPIAKQAVKGFKDGCASTHKNVNVHVAVTGSFDDVGLAQQAALTLISDGCDVLWHNLDAADAGVFAAAEDKGVDAIGLYGDESKLGPKASIGAAIANVAPLVFDAATKPLNGKVNYYGVEQGAVSFGAYAPRISQSVRQAVAKGQAALKSGKVTY